MTSTRLCQTPLLQDQVPVAMCVPIHLSLLWSQWGLVVLKQGEKSGMRGTEADWPMPPTLCPVLVQSSDLGVPDPGICPDLAL